MYAISKYTNFLSIIKFCVLLFFNSLRNVPKRYYVVLLLFFSDILKAYINACPILIIAEVTSERKIIVGNETKIIVSVAYLPSI